MDWIDYDNGSFLYAGDSLIALIYPIPNSSQDGDVVYMGEFRLEDNYKPAGWGSICREKSLDAQKVVMERLLRERWSALEKHYQRAKGIRAAIFSEQKGGG